MEHIQVTYQPVEDRLVLLIKASRQEYKLWLTRRFVVMFLAQLQTVTSNDPLVKEQVTEANQKQIMDFQQQKAQVSAKFNESKTDPNSLMEGELPQLATGIAINGQTLHIKCNSGKTLNMQLNTQLAYALKNLVEASLKKTGWGFTSVKAKKKEQKTEMPLPNYSVRIN